MSVKNKAILLVGLLFSLFAVFSLSHVSSIYNEHIEAQLKAQQEDFQDIVETVKKLSFEPYYPRIKGIVKTNPKIHAAFAKQNKKLLTQLITPKFQILSKENPYFHSLQFHLPDGSLFLSLVQSGDLRKPPQHSHGVSLTVARVHRERQFLAAFEEQGDGLYYLIVQPLFLQQQYIGALEFAIDARQLLDSLQDKLRTPVAFYFEREILKRSPWFATVTVPAGGHYLLGSTADQIIQAMVNRIDFSNNNQRLQSGEVSYASHVFPLFQDFQGQTFGGILTLQDITAILMSKRDFAIQASFFSFFLFLAAFAVLYFSFGEMIGKLESSRSKQTKLLVQLRSQVKTRQQAEKQLLSANERFATVMENLDAGVFVIDFQTLEILFANSYVLKRFGNVLGKVCWQVLMEGQTSQCDFCPGLFGGDYARHQGNEHVWEYYHPTHQAWFELREQIIRWVDGRLVHLKIATDITKRKAAEEELLKNQSILERTQAIANLGYWEWCREGGMLSLSNEACRILGVEPQSAPSSIEEYFAYVHAEDLEMVQNAFAAAVSGKGDMDLDVRLVRPDDRVCVVHQHAEVIFDEEGTSSHLLVTLQDITEIKEASQQLVLSANVFENSIEGIMITDAAANIQRVNRAFSDITGYSEAEVVGCNPRLLKSERHDRDFYSALWQSLEHRGHWQGEIWNRRKTGELYPQWTTISTIRDAVGRVVNYVGVFHDMSEIKQREEELKYQAQHDALTSLPNRLLFYDRLGVALGHARRKGQKLAVLFVDLDNFKNINDSLGHTVGDQLLVQLTERLIGAVREDDTVARYGGDEFILLLEGLQEEKAGLTLCQKIIRSLEAPFLVAERQLYITVSMGISFYPVDGADPETLIRNADMAMYRAKDMGKNTYQVFTAELNRKVVHRLSIENDLRRAIDREEFVVHYQPKVDLRTGTIAGSEALLRWQKGDGTLLSPLDFIPIAEETGSIVQLGSWVIHHVCAQVKGWHDRGWPVKVAINLSPRQFMQTGLVALIKEALARSGLAATALEFEVTESMLMVNEEYVIHTLGELKQMGVGLAIDDFGTGFSSLSYLKRLPIEVIKIDQSFIKDIPHDKEDVAITAAIVSMAHSLNLQLVAEGIETLDQLECLGTRGCQQGQGYYFSKPLPAQLFEKMLQAPPTFALPTPRGKMVH